MCRIIGNSGESESVDLSLDARDLRKSSVRHEHEMFVTFDIVRHRSPGVASLMKLAER